MSTNKTTHIVVFKPEFIENVKVAFLSLRREGVVPSIRNVRKRLGGGSNTWIAGVLRDYRQVWLDETLSLSEEEGDGSKLSNARKVVPDVVKMVEEEVESRFKRKMDQLKVTAEHFAQENIELGILNDNQADIILGLSSHIDALTADVGKLLPLTTKCDELQLSVACVEQQSQYHKDKVVEEISALAAHVHDQHQQIAISLEDVVSGLKDMSLAMMQCNPDRIGVQIEEGFKMILSCIEKNQKADKSIRIKEKQHLVKLMNRRNVTDKP